MVARKNLDDNKLSRMISLAAGVSKLSQAEILSHPYGNRRREDNNIVNVRHAIIYCLYLVFTPYGKITMSQIARLMHYSSHTAIQNAIRKVEDAYDVCEKFGIRDEKIKIIEKIIPIFDPRKLGYVVDYNYFCTKPNAWQNRRHRRTRINSKKP